MIYRNGRTLYYPAPDGAAWKAETHPSINAAKRQVRKEREAGERIALGKPPRQASSPAVEPGPRGAVE